MRRPSPRRRLLGMLAAYAIVAGACSKGKGAPVEVRSTADSADQVMFGVRTILTDKGVMRAQLTADTAYMFDESTRTEMRGVKTIFFTPQGTKNGTLTSRAGTYNSRLGTMEARGNVVIVTDDGRRLTTQQVRYDPSRNEVSGDSAFVFTQGEKRLEGVGFVSDPNMNNVRVLSGAKGSGGAFPIPKK